MLTENGPKKLQLPITLTAKVLETSIINLYQTVLGRKSSLSSTLWSYMFEYKIKTDICRKIQQQVQYLD